MNDIKRDEFFRTINQIWQIISLAKDCYSYSFYLYKADTKKENDYIAHSIDFIFFRHILLRIAIIELSKLYTTSGNDKFRLSKLISILEETNSYLKYDIPLKSITDWKKEIQNNKKDIELFITLRNKVYAHTDLDWNEYSTVKFDFQKIERLIKIAESIISEIYKITWGKDIDLAPDTFNKERFNIIKILADAELEKLKNY